MAERIPPTIDASLGVGMVGGVKATFIVLLAFSLCLSAVGADEKPLIADPVIEKEVRNDLKKPSGELPKANLEKVRWLFGPLFLNGAKITDLSHRNVGKLKKLEMLFLVNTQATDAGLKEVVKLDKLIYLNLRDTKITDKGLKEVTKLKQLERIELLGTKVTDAGLTEVGKLTHLTSLGLPPLNGGHRRIPSTP